MGDVVNAAHITGRRLNVAGAEEKASDIQTPEEGGQVCGGPCDDGGAECCAQGMWQILEFWAGLSDDNGLEDVVGNFTLTLDMPDRWNFGGDIETDKSCQCVCA